MDESPQEDLSVCGIRENTPPTVETRWFRPQQVESLARRQSGVESLRFLGPVVAECTVGEVRLGQAHSHQAVLQQLIATSAKSLAAVEKLCSAGKTNVSLKQKQLQEIELSEKGYSAM